MVCGGLSRGLDNEILMAGRVNVWLGMGIWVGRYLRYGYRHFLCLPVASDSHGYSVDIIVNIYLTFCLQKEKKRKVHR